MSQWSPSRAYVDLAQDGAGVEAVNPQLEHLTTAVVGGLVGYSTQQVRDLERLGVIPVADRAANGYRRYAQGHVIALRAYRALAAAIGPVPARQIMPVLIEGPTDVAAGRIDDLHVVIALGRARIREALRGIDAVLTDASDVFEEQDAMSIGELAQALDVRPSALRHWEHEGLVDPGRRNGSRSRRYDARAVTEARIVAALRDGGYPIPVISRVLERLRAHGLAAEVRTLLNERLSDLTRRSVALLEASAELHALLSRQGE
ncbi:MerR family transcriptional regulator [Microbacterium lushaniae]|uniref:MerR family transcriptional regulator n=1 Tax=Microbacterium lushaniae TaxID=2614639 RepID=A0A5J6L8Z1_9MICO|nr:MerR family transcriptional regulator [Microbacterium lushaniae]